MTTSPIQLQLETVFGVRAKLESSLAFADDQTIVYPAGNQFVLVNVEKKDQKIFRCPELEHVESIIVEPQSSTLAIISTRMNPEKNNMTISFYDLLANFGKRKRMFELAESPINIVSLAISHDAKHLAILDGSESDYTLTIWPWQKSRPIASMKLGQTDGVSVLSEILFHPKDHNLISIIGRRFYRTARHLDAHLRLQTSSAKFDQYFFKSHAWYSSDRCIAGTTDGHICILSHDDVKYEFEVVQGFDTKSTAALHRQSTMSSSLGKSHGRSSIQSHLNEHVDTSRPTGEEITAISVVNKGFFCLLGGRLLCRFIKIGENWEFSKIREYAIPGSTSSATQSLVLSSESQTSTEKLQQPADTPELMCKLVISPSEENVVVMSNKRQIYLVFETLGDKKEKSPEPTPLEFVFQANHQAAVRGLDIAVQKPLFISGSDDQTVRLWNYDTNTTEFVKTFSDTVTAISIHPTGHQMVVAFSSKLSLMNILVDGFKLLTNYSIHGAKIVRYSNGGHLFAAADSGIAKIISSVNFKVLYNLKHGQTISEIIWKRNDLGLFCQSMEILTTWKIGSETPLFTWKTKDRMAETFAVDREEKNFYLSFQDGSIRTLFQEKIINKMKLPQSDVATCLTLFPSNGALLCGTQSGSIYVIRTPFSDSQPGNLFHYLAHSAKVTRIVVAFHEALIISCCRDGDLMLWSTQTKMSFQTYDWSPVFLLSKSRSEEMTQMIEKLETERKGMQNQLQYRLQQSESNHLAEVQRLIALSDKDRNHQESQIELSLQEKRQENESFEKKCFDLMEKFRLEKERIERDDRDRMKREGGKEQELINLSHKMTEDNEFRLTETKEASERQIREIAEYYTGRIREVENELVELQKKNRIMLEDNERAKVAIEEDTEEEQKKLKVDFENERRRLIQDNQKHKKTFQETLEVQVNSLLKRQSEYDIAAAKYNKQMEEHKVRVQGMNQEIVSLHNEIRERTQTVREKDDRIENLDAKNQELEKFKYVLNFKIEELSKVIEPRNAEIKRMQEQLEQMANEKEKRQTELTANRFANEEKRRKVHAVEKHLEEVRRGRKETENLLRRIKNDIHADFGDLRDPKRLKTVVSNLNEKFILNEELRNIHAGEPEAQGISEERFREDRQRKYLELSMNDLKHRLSNDLHATKANRMRILNENSMLLRELNAVREELKIVRGRLLDYEIAKTTTETRAVNSIDALIQTLHSDAGNYQDRQRTNELIKESEKNQREIQRLRKLLGAVERGVESRKVSTSDVNDQSENVSIIKFA